MTKIRENGASSGVGVLAAYSYDDLGRRVSIARGNGAATSYAFDAASHAFERLRARGGLTNLTQNPAGSTY